jgi:hypothetical protein
LSAAWKSLLCWASAWRACCSEKPICRAAMWCCCEIMNEHPRSETIMGCDDNLSPPPSRTPLLLFTHLHDLPHHRVVRHGLRDGHRGRRRAGVRGVRRGRRRGHGRGHRLLQLRLVGRRRPAGGGAVRWWGARGVLQPSWLRLLPWLRAPAGLDVELVEEAAGHFGVLRLLRLPALRLAQLHLRAGVRGRLVRGRVGLWIGVKMEGGGGWTHAPTRTHRHIRGDSSPPTPSHTHRARPRTRAHTPQSRAAGCPGCTPCPPPRARAARCASRPRRKTRAPRSAARAARGRPPRPSPAAGSARRAPARPGSRGAPPGTPRSPAGFAPARGLAAGWRRPPRSAGTRAPPAPRCGPGPRPRPTRACNWMCVFVWEGGGLLSSLSGRICCHRKTAKRFLGWGSGS